MPSCPWSRPSAGPTGRWASLRSFPARYGGPMWRTWVGVVSNTHLRAIGPLQHSQSGAIGPLQSGALALQPVWGCIINH
eukprot:scaffold43352_cov70-Phaeocystis_antarctica.AAC.4